MCDTCPTEGPEVRIITPAEAGDIEGRMALDWDELVLSGGP